MPPRRGRGQWAGKEGVPTTRLGLRPAAMPHATRQRCRRSCTTQRRTQHPEERRQGKRLSLGRTKTAGQSRSSSTRPPAAAQAPVRRRRAQPCRCVTRPQTQATWTQAHVHTHHTHTHTHTHHTHTHTHAQGMVCETHSASSSATRQLRAHTSALTSMRCRTRCPHRRWCR